MVSAIFIHFIFYPESSLQSTCKKRLRYDENIEKHIVLSSMLHMFIFVIIGSC
jgi:hypothetical protein